MKSEAFSSKSKTQMGRGYVLAQYSNSGIDPPIARLSLQLTRPVQGSVAGAQCGDTSSYLQSLDSSL